MTASPTIICTVCGTENPSTRQFCRKCASDLRAIVPAPGQEVAPVAVPTTTTAPVPVRPILIGGGIAAVVAVILIGLLIMLGGSPAASPTPSSALSPEPTATATVTASPAPIATAAPTPTAVATPGGTPTATATPGTKPKVDTFTTPHTASCTGTNGTSTAGYIHVSWSASNATGVRLSIDPPAPNNAYGNGYADYPAVGSDDVPFTCDPPNSDATGKYHLYVVTTLHDSGHYAYRYMKVYLKP